MRAAPGHVDRAILPVGGHESRTGEGLDVPGGSALSAMAGIGALSDSGRGLSTALRVRRRAVAVPMTLGRDPGLASAAAQTLAWAAHDRTPGDLLLAGPLGTLTHLVGWIRAAVTRVLRRGNFQGAVLLVAPAAGPEADAELFKVARLVWQYLPVRWVEVALADGEPGVGEGVERCHRLGADEVTLVPASLVPPPPCPGATRAAEPLLGPAALATLIRERAAEAERRWERDGDEGLAVSDRHEHSHSHGEDHDRHHGDTRPDSTTRILKGAALHGG